MKIFKHLTANNIYLTQMPFQRELAMEAYLIENESVLALDTQTFENVEIIEDVWPKYDTLNYNNTAKNLKR